MKKYLTREESKKLIELGINPDNASLVNWKQTGSLDRKIIYGKEHLDIKPFRPAVMGFEDFDCQDIFSIGDLINLCPNKVQIDGFIYNLNMFTENNIWNIYYSFGDSDYYVCDYNEELITCLYNLVIKLKTDKLI